MKVITEWKGKREFDSKIGNHHITLDSSPEHGGNDSGPSPKPLLLSALSGCSGLDVVAILEKMKISDYKFKMELDVEMANTTPDYYKTIYVNFYFEGKELPHNKIMRAVNLSLEKYCGVYYMLDKASEIKHKIFINNKEI